VTGLAALAALAGLAGLPLAALPPVVHASYAMYILTALLLLPPLIFILLAKRGKELYIRRIPGIDAIEEGIGRATELGRPMMFSTGLTSIVPLLYAVLGIPRHVAGKAAQYGCRLICPQRDYEVLPIVEETIREAYRAAGRLDQFNPRDVRFLSTSQFAYASGYMGIAHREKAATCFLFGEFAAESLILAEAGQQIGAMQVAGTASYTQVPFFLTSCDYTIIGEEVYAAGAYLSREPAQLGSIRGQDVAKLVVLAMVLVGMIWATARVIAHRDYQEGWEYNVPFSRWLYIQPENKRVLSKIRFEDSYKPPKLPRHRSLEEGLASLRRKLGRAGSEVRRKLRRLLAQAESEEKALRASLGLFPAGAGRAEAEETAKALKDLADRLRLELEGAPAEVSPAPPAHLARLLAEDLPAAEKACGNMLRSRSADAFRPELAHLKHWASLQKGDPDCAKDGGAGPVGIERAIRRAREACYRKYYAQLAVQVREARLAAKEKTPRYLLRTRAALAGASEEKKQALGPPTLLLLDGTKSVSGRGRPMQMHYTWEVSPRPFKGAPPKFNRPKQPVRFDGPGAYTVKLKVSEVPEPTADGKISPKRLILSIAGKAVSLVEHRRLPAGLPLDVSWRLPKNLVKGSAKITFDFGEPDSTFTVTDKEHLCKHVYAQPGDYLMTITASYKVEKVAGRRAAVRAAAAADAAKGAGPELTALRERLGRTLQKLTDGLGKLTSDLKGLDELAGENWPDRKLAEALGKKAGELAGFVNGKANFLGPKAGAAEVFGSGARPGEEGPGAGGSGLKKEEASVWKRYRLYWHVVEPKSDVTEMRVEVEDAPARPPTPWPPEPGKGGAR